MSNLLNTIGDAASAGIGGGIGAALGEQIGYGLGELTGMNEKRRKQQLAQQKALTDIQSEANLGLMKESYKEQKTLWDTTNAEAQVAHLKAAGLNPALVYAKGGAGGSTSGGGGTSVGSGTASDESSRKQADIAAMGMGLQMQRIQSEIDVNKSIAEKNRAEAQTTEESRTYVIDKLRQEGHGAWLDNIKNQYVMGDTGNVVHKNAMTGKTAYISDSSLFTEQITTDIAKAQAEKGNAEAQALLANEKAKGYFQELLNDTLRADSDKIRATAQKLATEFNTGEFTNWKTWADLASQTIKLIVPIM